MVLSTWIFFGSLIALGFAFVKASRPRKGFAREVPVPYEEIYFIPGLGLLLLSGAVKGIEIAASNEKAFLQ